MARNVDTAEAKPPAWDPGNLKGSLDGLYAWVDEQATQIIRWYYEHKRWKAILSRALRLLAILFGAAGAFIPMLALLLGDRATQMSQAGYLALGLAALCIALDRFYGFSTGWMRFIHTAMLIEGRLEVFRLDWSKLKVEQGDAALDVERLELYLARVETFVAEVRACVQKETEEWMAEFQTNLTQLQQETAHAWESVREETHRKLEEVEAARHVVAEEQPPGAIQLTIAGDVPLDDGMLVELDGKPCFDHVIGTTCGIARVPPGFHKVALSGLVGGRRKRATSVVSVEPNKTATVSMELQ